MKNKFTATTDPYIQNGKHYLEQKILSASPEQLISYVFDAAISGCIKRDIKKTSSALHVLTNSLNFGEKEEQKDLASKFYKTYKYLFELLREKKFDDVHKNLKEIKESWSKAMNVY